jgi:WD40 repeat protein
MHVRLTGHTAAVCRVRCLTLPDWGTVLASASDDGTIRLWDPATATPLGTPLTGHTSTVEDLTVLTRPDGRTLLASAGGDGSVRVWDPVSGHPVGVPLTGHTGRVWGVCPLPGVGSGYWSARWADPVGLRRGRWDGAGVGSGQWPSGG